jgi:hypothetical protein
VLTTASSEASKVCCRYSRPAISRGGKASAGSERYREHAFDLSPVDQRSHLTSGCCMLICSSRRGRNSSAVCGCEGFGPIGLLGGIAGKQVLAKPYPANPAPINQQNQQNFGTDQGLALCSGRTNDLRAFFRFQLPDLG